jgi:hypothetical protein
MYETYRELDRRSTKQVAVFRSLPAALVWLGVEERTGRTEAGQSPADV